MKKHIIAAFLSFVFGGAAMASAPMSKVTIPGIYRIHVGNFEVTALSDGTLDLPMAKLMSNVTATEFKKATEKAALADAFETSVNAFLINTGTQLVLVDSGAGSLFGPTVGRVLTNLKAAGYQPEQVDAVLITHMHPDHIGGLTADGKMIFANATVYADKAESAYWLNERHLASDSTKNNEFFAQASAALAPYQKAGKLKALPDDGSILPGIHSKSAFGHTAGHTTYMVENNNAKLVLLGDLVHVAAVQFEKPTATIQFDTDTKAATAARISAFDQAAKENYMIGASHLSFPGFGHVRKEKKAFAYIPLNYTR